ncbi:MAG: 50S ribosomal protein L10 [bacterium]
MPVSKQQKKESLARVSSGLDNAETVVFANFKGLTLGETTELRKGLRENSVSYMVAKKTLIKKALAEKGYKGELPELVGELAIAWGKDQLAPAKALADFQKKFDKRISILGGVFEGEFKDKAAMLSIAAIPSREVLLSQIAYLLKSPIQMFAIAVSEVAKKKA